MADKQLDEYIVKTDLDNFETDNLGTQTKKVSLYDFDTENLTKKKITGRETESGFALETSITNGLNISSYDYFSLTQDTLTDTYTFKLGGATGTVVATVLITYTSADKSTISSVLKS